MIKMDGNVELLKSHLEKKLGEGFKVYINRTQLNIDIDGHDVKFYTKASELTSKVVLYVYDKTQEHNISSYLDKIPSKYKLWNKIKGTSIDNQTGIYGIMLENAHHVIREFTRNLKGIVVA